MAVEWENGIPILTGESLLSDVPEYTQALAAANITPVGAIMPYMGTRCPNYWLFCDGKSYDANYFHVMHDYVNSAIHGDRFRMPDMRGRMPIGQTNLNGGSYGGGWAEEHPDFPPNNDGPATSIFNGERGGDWRLQNHWHKTLHTATSPGGNWGLQVVTNGIYSDEETNNFWPVRDVEPSGVGGTGNAKNMPPFIGLNFIIYTGLPTYDESGNILPECGQGAEIAPVTTRMMIEQRLAKAAGLDAEEVKMLKEQLAELKERDAK